MSQLKSKSCLCALTLLLPATFLPALAACDKSDEKNAEQNKPSAEPAQTEGASDNESSGADEGSASGRSEKGSSEKGSSEKKGKVIYKRDPPKGKNVFERLEAVGKLEPVEAKPVAKVPVSPGDPEKGDFTLEEATQGLEGDGKLQAEIVTELGTLKCELYEDKAPITVANFVGLARGTRPWKKDGKWVKEPLYDGTTFHRVIKRFMIQGGDPAGNGSGGPGYVIPDEIWEDARHSQVGLLCMANRGPNTNGSQFFILNNMALHLDGSYTIFGKCGPDELIDKIASVPVRGDRAVKPPKIKSIDISRKK